ncbi:MAG: cupin domain-containing protein [Erysipelotrichaceae bacterium]
MNLQAKLWIDQYGMLPHPEGGYYVETLLAPDHIAIEDRPTRPLYSSILFLLSDLDVSHFHTLQSDEVWYYQNGDPLDIVVIDEDGVLEIIHLGPFRNQVMQALVRKGCVFGSLVPNHGASLVGCMVSPGFLFEEFTLHTQTELILRYPEHQEWIEKLTKSEVEEEIEG